MKTNSIIAITASILIAILVVLALIMKQRYFDIPIYIITGIAILLMLINKKKAGKPHE